MELIETVELASSASSITFSSIPQTYTDLCLVFSLRSDRSGNGDYVAFAFNGSTAGFTSVGLYNFSTTIVTQTDLDRYATIPSAGSVSNTFGNGQTYISNYSGNTNKSFSTDGVFGDGGNINASLWSNTAAITSIEFSPAIGSTFNQYSIISLYGITAGSGGATVS